MPELNYIPAPAKPEWFDKELERIGGRAPNGLPRYRAVWGMDEKEFFAGQDVIKYCSFQPGDVGMPRWIIENWVAPTFYSPAEWREHPELGAYPSRGIYMFMFVVRDEETGDYAPLDKPVIEQVEWHQRNRTHPHIDLQEYQQQAERRAAMRRKRDEYLEEENRERWKEYFAKEDYMNASREYSFADKRRKPEAVERAVAAIQQPAGAGETRTAGGIILPAGVSI